MHRVEQERANTCSKQAKSRVFKDFEKFVSSHRFIIFIGFWTPKYLSKEGRKSYPHRTAALCAGCILPCTCRLWWLGRWGGTAGNSLHCYYCTDWCLGTEKQHGNKYTKQIKEELWRHKQMCFGPDKQPLCPSKQNRPSMRQGKI